MNQLESSHVLMPGDTLVLVYKKTLSVEQMDRLKEYGKQIGIKCAVVMGCDDLYIQRAYAPAINMNQTGVVDGSPDIDRFKAEVGESLNPSPQE